MSVLIYELLPLESINFYVIVCITVSSVYPVIAVWIHVILVGYINLLSN